MNCTPGVCSWPGMPILALGLPTYISLLRTGIPALPPETPLGATVIQSSDCWGLECETYRPDEPGEQCRREQGLKHRRPDGLDPIFYRPGSLLSFSSTILDGRIRSQRRRSPPASATRPDRCP